MDIVIGFCYKFIEYFFCFVGFGYMYFYILLWYVWEICVEMVIYEFKFLWVFRNLCFDKGIENMKFSFGCINYSCVVGEFVSFGIIYVIFWSW